MKRLFALFCLALYLNGASWQLFTLACFYANQQTIIRTLCENRTRPQLHCDGYCVLAKKLKAADAKQDGPATLNLTRLHEHAPASPVEVQVVQPAATSPEVVMAVQDLAAGMTAPVWQPPQV